MNVDFGQISNALAYTQLRIVSDPLRFESDLFINHRFLSSFMLLLLGLLFGIWSGKYFYRERFLVGAALVGIGWLCGMIGFGINGRWFL